MEKSVQITCVAEAIKNKVLTGKFIRDDHTYEFPPVENTDVKGNKSEWIISVSAFDTDKCQTVPIILKYYKCPILLQPPKNIVAKISTEIKKHTGHIQIGNDTIIDVGKNIGKSNASTPISQAIHEAYRKWVNKDKKSNNESSANTSRPQPMLYLPYDTCPLKAKHTEDDYKVGIVIQPKLDGVRAIAHMLSDNTIEFYTRGLKQLVVLDHISPEICKMISNQKSIMTSIFLDGEIYKHGVPLQVISGAVRGENNNLTEKLEFHLFDCFVVDDKKMPYEDRLKLLKSMYRNSYKYVKLVQTYIVNSKTEINDLFKKFYKTEGYEGAVAKRLCGVYKFGVGSQRSCDILKIKPDLDSEFEIIDYKEGKGKDKGAITFLLKTDKNIPFSAVPNETIEERKRLFSGFESNKKLFNDKYKGRMATIQYAGLSMRGVPQQPKFIRIRHIE